MNKYVQRASERGREGSVGYNNTIIRIGDDIKMDVLVEA